MKNEVITGLFGTIKKNKVIDFPHGIIGFSDMKEWMLIKDLESDSELLFLQSLDEPGFVLPVVNPLFIMPDYHPDIPDSVEDIIGSLKEDDFSILCTVTVPVNMEDISVNLSGPIIINAETFKGVQILVENSEYPVKYKVYDILRCKAGI